MKAANTYLHFDGNCREAMTFYGQCLQAEPNFTSYSGGPADVAEIAKAAPERILHAQFASGPVVLMASDVPPGSPFDKGNNFSISIDCDSEAEMQRLFAELSEGGTVLMPVEDAFWGGRFGMFVDRFGISWMVSFRE